MLTLVLGLSPIFSPQSLHFCGKAGWMLLLSVNFECVCVELPSQWNNKYKMGKDSMKNRVWPFFHALVILFGWFLFKYCSIATVCLTYFKTSVRQPLRLIGSKTIASEPQITKLYASLNSRARLWNPLKVTVVLLLFGCSLNNWNRFSAAG